jgi:copper resistance protein B
MASWLTTVFVLAATVAATSRASAEEMLDRRIFSLIMLDRLEYRWNQEANTVNWNAQAWVGGDYNRFWFKTSGVKLGEGAVEEAEAQFLYSRLIAPFWDLQLGWRYDDKPRPSRGYAVAGLKGLAPYWIEVDAAVFLSEQGDILARFEAAHDVLLTQRLVLQPRFETNLAVQRVEELGIGQGINDVEVELRLRYELRREFAPYLGVAWRRDLGATAGMTRRAGRDVEDFAGLAGIRAWF